MRAGILLIVLYWALFTIRAGLQPKVAAEVKAATYDMKRASGLEKLEHTRRLQCWTVAKWALRVCGWAENVLLGVVTDHVDGLVLVDLVVYVPLSILKTIPQKGLNMEIGDHIYQITKVHPEAGEIVLYLEMLTE